MKFHFSQNQTSSKNRNLTPILLSVWTIIFFLCSYIYSGTAAGDDTFIYMRYVDNVLRGNGLTYNPGELSYGVTSFLWTLLMIPIAQIFGNTVILWKITSTLFFSLGILFILITVRNTSSTWTNWIVILVCLLEPYTFRWSGSGMENGLTVFVLGLVTIIWFSIHDKVKLFNKPINSLLLGVVCGLMPFTRPELGILSVLISGLYIYRKKHSIQLIINFIIGLFIVVLLLGLTSYILLGSILPQTAAAKALNLNQKDSLYGLKQSLRILLTGGGTALAFIFFYIVGQLRKKIWSLNLSWALAISSSTFAILVYLSIVNQLTSTRYASCFVYPLIIAFIVLIRETWDEAARNKVQFIAAWGALIIQILISVSVLIYLFPATRTAEHNDIQPIAEYFQANTESKTRVALSELGAFGFYSNRYIIDLVGLTDRQTLVWYQNHGGRPTLSQAQFEQLLLDRDADYYIDTFATGTPLNQGINLEYQLIKEFEVVRNNMSQQKIKPDLWRIYKIWKK